MAQYIDKSVLVAEIEKIKKSTSSDRFLSEFEKGCNHGKEDVCDDLLSFLDTLDVKNVDLNATDEQEKQQWIDKAVQFINDKLQGKHIEWKDEYCWCLECFIAQFKKSMEGE